MPTFPKDVKILNLGALNCQGLKEKVDQSTFTDLLHEFDLFGVSETWLTDGNEKEIFVSGYKFYSVNRKTTKGASRGGVGMFLKKGLKKHVKLRRDLSNENFLWCRIAKEYLGYQDGLYVCVVYIPPKYSSRELGGKYDHFKHLGTQPPKLEAKILFSWVISMQERKRWKTP